MSNSPVTRTPNRNLLDQATGFVRNLPADSAAYVKSLFPFFSWLPRYNFHWFIGDFIAGITVALVVIPQAISYASNLANLPAEFGLYTSFIGCLIYALFATSKDVTIGPTAVLSLLVGQQIALYVPNATPAEAVSFAVALSFWTGLFQAVFGLFRIGLVVEFVPIPVIAGFTSGAGFQIMIGQLPALFGIKGIDTNNAPYQVLFEFFSKISLTSKYDFIFGITALTIILILKYSMAYCSQIYYSGFKYVGFLRNAIVLIIFTGISYSLRNSPTISFSIVKNIPYGLSGIVQPDLSLQFAKTVFPAIPAVFIVGILEHIAVVKTYSRSNGYSTNPNQEIIAIGLTNLLGSFVGGYPSTGSFSRSAIKSESGVRSPAGSFITGVLVIVGLFTLTDVLYFIPNAVLSAIVISAISELFHNFSIIESLIEIEPLDFVGFLIALFVTFASSIEYAIYSSVAFSLLVLLIRIARPRIKILSRTSAGHWVEAPASSSSEETFSTQTGILVFQIDQSLTYPNSSFFNDSLKESLFDRFKLTAKSVSNAERSWSDDTEERLRRRERYFGVQDLPPLRAIVFDFSAVSNIDYTGYQALIDARNNAARFAGRSVPFHFVNARDVYLNTLVRVQMIHPAVTRADVPTISRRPSMESLLSRMDEESVAEQRAESKAVVDGNFHNSIDEAVETADNETRWLIEGRGSSIDIISSSS